MERLQKKTSEFKVYGFTEDGRATALRNMNSYPAGKFIFLSRKDKKKQCTVSKATHLLQKNTTKQH